MRKVFFIIIVLVLAGCEVQEPKVVVKPNNYDQNDPAYRFVPAAPDEWKELFGDNERTRLIHSISEMRVVIAAQGGRILELEKRLADPNETETRDPNEATY